MVGPFVNCMVFLSHQEEGFPISNLIFWRPKRPGSFPTKVYYKTWKKGQVHLKKEPGGLTSANPLLDTYHFRGKDPEETHWPHLLML